MIEGTSILRNQANYWEPGVLQTILNLHIFQILIDNKESIKKAILPIFLVFSTFSTTGLVVMLIIVVYRYFYMDGILKRIKPITKVLFLLILLFVSTIVVNNVLDKLQGSGSESAMARTYDYMMGIDVIKSNPLFGIGPDQDRYLKMNKMLDLGYYDVQNLERGNTNSVISIAVQFGLPCLFLFLYALYNQNIFTNRKLFFFLMFVLLMSEPLFGLTFIYLVIFTCLPEYRSLRKKHVQLEMKKRK